MCSVLSNRIGAKGVRTLLTVSLVLFSLVVNVRAQPDIYPSDTYHDFGDVGVGLESEWDLVLVNVGDGALYISSVTPSLSEFTISQPVFPVTMTPGESLAVTVVFQPASVGLVDGLIEVVSNDPDGSPLTIDVEGTGIDVAHLSLPDTLVPAGAQIFLPVRIGDVTGLGITSIALRIVFDEDVVSASGATVVGALTETWDLDVSTGIDQIEIGLSGPAPLAGSGVVAFVDMSLPGGVSPGQSTPLILTDVLFNEGVPLAAPHDGQLTAASYAISGLVSYYKNGGPVPDVRLLLQGETDDSTWTGPTGSYLFAAVPGGRDYIVAPSKRGDVQGAINSYDASLVMRYSISLVTLSPLQILAADVSGNGEISGLDASYILQFRVGMIDRFPTGQEWLFLPSETRYDSLGSDQFDQDYSAVAYGDVSGNWSAGGGYKYVSSSEGLRLGPAVVLSRTDETMLVSVPVCVKNVGDFCAADFEFRFDETTVRPISVEKSPAVSDYLLASHARDGSLRIAMAGTENLPGQGEVFSLQFQVLSAQDFESVIPMEIWATVDDGRVVADGQQVYLNQQKSTIPTAFGLEQNYPNPFNPTTDISYQIADGRSSVHTTLKIYNMLGQEVRTLVNETKEPGSYTVTWDGRDSRGMRVSSGIYSYRMAAGQFMTSKQMILLQ